MLFRLSQVAPTAVSQRLDETTPQLEKTMKGATVTKDTVKQDLERATELQRSALRAIAALGKIGAGVSPKFDVFVEEINGTMGDGHRGLADLDRSRTRQIGPAGELEYLNGELCTGRRVEGGSRVEDCYHTILAIPSLYSTPVPKTTLY